MRSILAFILLITSFSPLASVYMLEPDLEDMQAAFEKMTPEEQAKYLAEQEMAMNITLAVILVIGGAAFTLHQYRKGKFDKSYMSSWHYNWLRHPDYMELLLEATAITSVEMKNPGTRWTFHVALSCYETTIVSLLAKNKIKNPALKSELLEYVNTMQVCETAWSLYNHPNMKVQHDKIDVSSARVQKLIEGFERVEAAITELDDTYPKYSERMAHYMANKDIKLEA
ncbi:hypothetical protein [Pseudoalteromonas rubra]|uniref:hypothetical protein n=1 Tax=Pseudoalteromonas rubra TaxID=43658 RepID=UPI002DBDF424|nr:hypothetical protein [Pseudoalteromonas rubra]MEC4091825.1 hypothetical protein [Pseudoalteromonas rubra]